MATRCVEHIYVYYRLQGDPASARAAVARQFADIEARTGVGGRLLERRDDPLTWMEVYEPVFRPAAFLRVLGAAVARSGTAACAADGRRVIERFGAHRRPAAATETR
jgi:hypothetical protein